MFTISDSGVLDFTLSQKENQPPKLTVIKPKALPYLQTITIHNLFEGHLTHITTKKLMNILEYTMPFKNVYPISPKPILFGHPDQPNSFLEDTEHLFHFNRHTGAIELSHIVRGKRSYHMTGEIWSSYQNSRTNIKAHIHASWIFENEMVLDLMPYIGPYLDTYTPLSGFEKTQDIDIKGPFEDGIFIKKVRHKGPFYQRLVDKMPIEENLIYHIDYSSNSTKELSFHIPQPYGRTFLDTSEGFKWQEHIIRMIRRIDLLQSRSQLITLKTPFLDVTLDDEIIMGDKCGKVIEYNISPLFTTITLALSSPLNPINKSEVQRQYIESEKNLLVQVKNDITAQEAFLAEGITSIKTIPKTKIEVMF